MRAADRTLEALLEASRENKVAAMREPNLDYLVRFLSRDAAPKTVLEIGTGCGYSAYRMSLSGSVAKIVTVEKDPKRHAVAKALLARVPKIELVNADARDYLRQSGLRGRFDAIVLDGPKRRVEELIELSLGLLGEGGVCAVDNLFLNEIRERHSKRPQKRLENLVAASDALQRYVAALDKKAYDVTVDRSGDGLCIIRKR